MYCVIQVLQRKKPDLHGAYREYKVSSSSICKLDGTIIKTHYSYDPDYNKGRFERLHRESYKISIHESHRENGKVVKKQCVVGTIGYYELMEGLLFDYVEDGIQRAADVFNADFEYLYQMVEDKMQPVIDRINKEFQESEEYKAEEERKQLKKVYLETKKQFAEKYNVDADEYDRCYNIFGELMDAQYLQKSFSAMKHSRRHTNSTGSISANITAAVLLLYLPIATVITRKNC